MFDRRQKIIVIFFIFLTAIVLSIMPVSAGVASAAYKSGDTSMVTKVLSHDYTGAEWVYSLYKLCRGFVNIIALIVLLIIAFANILHINIETYSIKKLLLPLIIALVLANVAMPIFAIFSRIIDELQTLSIFKPDYLDPTYILGALNPFKFMGASTGFNWPALGITMILLAAIVALFASGFGILIAIILFVLVFGLLVVLSMIMAFRPYVIYVMVAISPVAIILSVLPMTQQLFKRWLGIIIPWMIMPLAVFFLINIGNLITVTAGSMMMVGSGVIGNIVGYFLPALIKLGLLVLAIRFPFTVEKDISSMIGKIGNFAGKTAWAGVGAGINLAYLVRNAREIRERDRVMSEMRKGLGGDEKAIKSITATRKGQIVDEQKKAQAKQRALIKKHGSVDEVPPSEQLTREEQGLLRMNDKDITKEAERYARGEDIARGLEDFEKERVQEHRKALNAASQTARDIDANDRTAEQQKLAEMEESDINTEAIRRAKEDARLYKANLEEEKIGQFGITSGFAFSATNPIQRFFWGLMRANPYGIMATVRDKQEARNKESQKTYDKYSSVGSYTRGRIFDTKFQQAIVKEDLGELPTAEQMMDYCQFWMKHFYAQVQRTLTQQGMEGVTEEQAVKVGNNFLKQFRTDVKGTKDYLAHPYFRGLPSRAAATIIEGDYNISRQIAIEMRRGNRIVESTQVEQRKIEMYNRGGSEVDKGSQASVIRESQQADEVRTRNTQNLLRNIERAIINNPGQDPTALARAMASQVQLGGLNRDDFHRQNVEVVMPAIAQQAQKLGLDIDVNATLRGGQALNTGQIENTMATAGISDEKMRALLKQYTVNTIAGLAVAGHASEGTTTANVARKIADSPQSPEDIADSTTELLGGRPS